MQRHLRRLLAVSGIVAAVVAGCSSEAPRKGSTDAPRVTAAPVDSTALSLRAEALNEPGRQERMFGTDLTEVAVLPLQVELRNRSNRAIQIATEHFVLMLPGGESVAPASAAEAAWLASPKAGVADYAAGGIGMLGGLAGPIGALAGRFIAMAAGGLLNWYRGDAQEDLQEDYARQELKTGELAPHQSARGILFFLIPNGTPHFDQATLSFRLRRPDSPEETVTISLKNLNYQGLPGPNTQDPADEPLQPRGR